MITNLFLLFICVNVGLGIIHVPGSPLSPTNSSCFYPDGMEADPVANQPMGDGGSIDSMTDLESEIQYPTNSTDTGSGTFVGDGEPFGIFDSLSRSLKSLEMMANLITGGYVMDTIQHLTIACEMDKDPNSPTYNQLIPMDDGSGGNAMWDYIKGGYQIIITLLIVYLSLIHI